jgi:thiosulfate/3-mercaptopyruvate sulfurtransferase
MLTGAMTMNPFSLNSSVLSKPLHDGQRQPGGRSVNNTLSHADAVAAARAGYGDVRAYYLSFADWAKDESCSIVRD